jgi:DNA-binding MarR family transcriptional regulator
MPQLICLQALRGLGQAPLSTLAKQIHLGSPTVLGIVDRLEEKGLLCRERSRQDRRKVLIELTEEGRSLLDRTPSLLQDRLSHSLNLLEPLARQQIASSLENIVHMMGMDHLDAAPHLLPHAEIESEANQDPRSEH